MANEIDAGAIKLQPPKIRPINRAQPKRRTASADNLIRPAVRAVSADDKRSVEISEEFRSATTASTLELIASSTDVIGSVKTVEMLTHKVEVIRNEATAKFHSNAATVVRTVTAEHQQFIDKNTVERQGAITEWETPYNKPSSESPENIQYTRLALQYLQQGRIEDAERLYKQALVVAERTFPEGDSAISRAVEDLATFYYGHDKFKQAEPFVSRLLKQRVENLSCDDWLLIRTVDQLADVYEKCGEPVQAQALYKLLLARQEESAGHNSPVCAFTLSRLADSYLRQEHFSAAESLLHTILGIQETLHGRCSIEISTTLQELASIYQKLGRYDRAAEMLERLLHVLETIHGDNGLSVASCLLKLADLLTEIEMVSEAEPLYRRAQEIYTLSYGDRTAAHSMFKKKIERVTTTMTNLSSLPKLSKLSKDKPPEQEACSRFPAIRLNLDDMLPSKLGTGQVNRCLGHAISPDVVAENVVPLFEENVIHLESATCEMSVSMLTSAVSSDEDASGASEFSSTIEMSVSGFETSRTMEMFAPSFDYSPTDERENLVSELVKTSEVRASEFDFSVSIDTIATEFSVPGASFAPDFSVTREMIAPQFNFTPSFEINAPIFDSARNTYDFVDSKFESNGELDSILDPFFASELAMIYETTTADKVDGIVDERLVQQPVQQPVQQQVQIDQQDTILDLEPATTLNLNRVVETTNLSNGKKSPKKSARTTSVLDAVTTTKPSRLADKTEALPALSIPVPGLVTVTTARVSTETEVNSRTQSQTPVQLRETVREKPILLPEPFPSSRRKSATQSMFAVTHPGTKAPR
ncbi:MAG: tetratricopeptide repeat protein [Candidatus Melainabacteria bacterium]|nr:tetratricopeptide repeat protein [Candidatus Melainabacteria bacterium]